MKRAPRWDRATKGTTAARSAVAACAGAFLAVGITGCGALASLTEESSAVTTASTYAPAPAVPASLPDSPGEPGDVISTEETMPPRTARAWRVDHRSTSASGDDIPMRSLLVVPMKEAPPDGFPLVVWGHSTKGMADSCAPSHEGATTIPLIDDLVREGYAVVAPDYEGLGAEGPNPYLVGPSEGRSMLDAARAASRVKGSGVRETSPVLLWGFSQGGHAAAFAGELAPSYAPELDLRGVAMAAPVSNVAHFARRSETWPAQMGVLVSIVQGFTAAYPELDPAEVLTDSALADISQLEQLCVSEVNVLYDRPVGETLRRSPMDVPAWADRLEESRSGRDPIEVPVLVIQGDADDIIDPADTDAMVAEYCGHGTEVSYSVRPGENHGVLTSDILLPWLRARVAGDDAPSTCGAR